MPLDSVVWAWDTTLDPASKLVLMVVADCESVDGYCVIRDVGRAAARASVQPDSFLPYCLLLGQMGYLSHIEDEPPTFRLTYRENRT